MAVRAKLIFGLFCIGGAVALLAVRAPAQQTANQAESRMPSTTADPAALDAQLRPYGFAMLDAPLRQGPYYLVRARDPRGIETRMVIEADSGQIVSATPVTTAVRPPDYSPYYDASPRIISIPQADDMPVPQRQARVTHDRPETHRASAPQRPVRTAARAPVQEPIAEPAQPRRVVRQVVPPREQPYRRPYHPAAVPLPPVDPSPRVETPQVSALPVTSPAVSPETPLPQAAPTPPRTRPRTVLAPPPYAEGPTPLKPLYHRDSNRFAPAQSELPPAPSDARTAPDVLPGSDRHAAVQPTLPAIPAAPATPLPEGAGAPTPQAADAHANANETSPEEIPPGTVTLDPPPR